MLCPIHPEYQVAGEQAVRAATILRKPRTAKAAPYPTNAPGPVTFNATTPKRLLPEPGDAPVPAARGFVAPLPMSAAERACLESEKACLLRERDTVQRGIDHLTDLLAA